jgi:hypothetical protein
MTHNLQQHNIINNTGYSLLCCNDCFKLYKVYSNGPKDEVRWNAGGGVPLNGVPLNGVPLNGVPLNGVPLNGVPLNGVPLNQIQQSKNTIVCNNCDKYDFFINDDIVIHYINEYPEIWFFYNKDYNKFKFLLYKSQYCYNNKGGGVICVFTQLCDSVNNFVLTFPIKNFI